MENVIITRPVSLPSRFLTSKYKEHLLATIVKHTDNECSLKHGYILQVTGLEQILANGVTTGSSENIFIVNFSADVIKPDIGKVVTGVVCLIFEGGILVSVADRFKVTIPAHALEDHFDLSSDESEYLRKHRLTPLSLYMSGLYQALSHPRRLINAWHQQATGRITSYSVGSILTAGEQIVPRGPDSIKEDDEIAVKIVNTRYKCDKKSFGCIGNLVV
jgi:DNA-directed RNA polymerase II subunit RPB7